MLYAYTRGSLLEDNKASQTTEITHRRLDQIKLCFHESASGLAARVGTLYTLPCAPHQHLVLLYAQIYLFA
jgi:hypothetical protein